MDNYNTAVKKIQEVDIPKRFKYRYFKEVHQGHVIDAVRMTFKPKQHIEKVSKTKYIRIYQLTIDGKEEKVYGEECEFMPKDETGGNMRNKRSLRKIFKDLRQLITTNYKGGNNELFITLTYAEQTNDNKQIMKDFEIFWKKLRRYVNDENLSYISIVEPHASGNFHIHMLLKTESELFIPDTDIRRMWGKGITTTERLNDVNNVGAYFIAYFSNMELNEAEIAKYEAESDIKIKDGKKFIKGERLKFYPDWMKIYRTSKNIKKPEVTHEGYLPDDWEQTYISSVMLSSDEGAECYITTEQRREKKQ